MPQPIHWIETFRTPAFVADAHGNVLVANQALIRASARMDAPLLAKSDGVVAAPTMQEAIAKAVREGVATTNVGEARLRLEPLAGPQQWYVCFADVEEHEPDEAPALEAHTDNPFLDLVTRTIPDMLTSYDLETGELVYTNRKTELNPLGWASGAIANIYTHVGGQMVHADDQEQFFADLAALRAGGLPSQEVTFRLRDAQGGYHWVHSRRMPLELEADGRVRRAVFIARDVTESKAAEEELTRFKQRYRLASEAGATGVWEYDAAAKTIFLDLPMQQALGLGGLHSVGLRQAINLMGEQAYAVLKGGVGAGLHLPRPSFEHIITLTPPAGQHPRQLLLRGALVLRDGGLERIIGTCTDVTQTILIERALERAETDFEALLRSFPDAFLRVDAQGRVLASYVGTPQLYPATLVEAQGKQLEQAMPPRPAHRLQQLIRAALVEQKPRIYEFLADLDGVINQYECRLFPLTARELALMVRNTTALMADKRTLVEAKVNAEKAMRAKDEFLSVMSHEIRTPLNSVVGMVHLLAGEPMPARQAKMVATLAEGAGNLVALIDSILSFSRMQAGGQALVVETFSLQGVLHSIVEQFLPEAQAKGLYLKLEVRSALPELVIGDRGILTQIANNLIGNAIKFTATGGITVGLNVAKEEAGQCQVYLTVADTGIGVDAAQQELIFEPFRQASSETGRRYGGTGLGLSIVRTLAEAQGGSVVLDSKPGLGSTFTVTLAYEISQEKTQAAQPAHGSLSTMDLGGTTLLDGLQVLAVDDVASNQFYLRALLDRWGVAPDLASSGNEALDTASRNVYDVVLMDVQMPGMDGYQTTRHLRRMELGSGKRSRIIALTADVSERVRKRLTAVGADDCLTKPFAPAALYKLLYEVWEAKQKPEEKKADAPALPHPNLVADTLKFSYFDDLYGALPAQYQEMLALYQVEYATYAADLASAVLGGDEVAFRKIKHKIVYSLHLLGLDALGKALEGLAPAIAHQPELARRQTADVFAAIFAHLQDAFAKQRERLETVNT